MQAAFEYFIAILVSDAYLAKLLTHIGLDDSLIGIIASLISAAFLFQLTAVFHVFDDPIDGGIQVILHFTESVSLIIEIAFGINMISTKKLISIEMKIHHWLA